MGGSVSYQQVQNTLEQNMTKEQYTNLQRLISEQTAQLNQLVIYHVDSVRIDSMQLKNDLTITTSLDLCQQEADRLHLSQDVKDLLEAAQRTSGIGALSSGNQSFINRLKTQVSIKDVDNIITSVRRDVTQKNTVAFHDVGSIDIRTIAIGNKGYNEDLTHALEERFRDVIGDQATKGDEKAKQDTTGFDLAAIFKSLTGPLIAAAGLGVVVLQAITATSNEFDIQLSEGAMKQHRTLSRSYISAESTYGFYILEIDFQFNRTRTMNVYRKSGADDENWYLGYYLSPIARAHVRVLDPVTRQPTTDTIHSICLVFETYSGVENDNSFVLDHCL
ncbi:hypothetical protein PAPYR_6574 [Paratrimastix pyriformis]|uniref:Uncharacterized protein n=2 Tax=Paratrimastix pyriformis TaxID=342808 RepID=A0ABQ8UBV5_9EUKA|nr:hypothetical protein PAPYR_9137 [Paratrimastix pyriformis]KAJ4457895.1 hypothetical protein PAPYR_6574 [Paratrimastix pyriformis]